MSEKGDKDYWSDCVLVFFTGCFGWGLTDKLDNICLGSEDDIKRFFDTGELNNGLHSTQTQVSSGILDYRKENGIGTTDTRTADMERAGNNGASRRKQKTTRHLTARKGLSLRPSRKKSKNLSRK